jgi:hypothetical protein
MSGANMLKRAEVESRTVNSPDNLQHQNVKITCKKIRKVICSNCYLTICEVAEEVQITKTMWQEILTENLGMHGVAAHAE